MTEKAITLCVYKVLYEDSDEDHPLSAPAIAEKIDARFGLHPDRRTVYSAIDTLGEFGYDISTKADNGRGYYLISREMDPTEVQLLTDAVYSFPFISRKQTESLTKCIQSFQSAYQRKGMHNLTVIRSGNKSLNKEIFYNLEVLDSAIDKHVKIRFDYMEYGLDLKLHPRREEKYIVNPYGMVYCNEHYYLACVYTGSEKASLYRLDRISNIELTDEPLDNRMTKAEVQSWIEHAAYAQVGQPERVTLLVERRYFGDVIDKFGTDVIASEDPDGRVRVTVKCNRNGMKYWALQYIQHVEVVAPEELRREIGEMVNSGTYASE